MEKIKITTGLSRFDKDWKVVETTWSDFLQRLRKPVRTKETMAEYKAMTRQARCAVKDVGGYVGGPMERDGARNNVSCNWRTLVTIDIDGETAVPDTSKIITVLNTFGCAYVLHPTHSWTTDKPRFRAVLPLDRPVSAEEYTPIALKVAERIGFDVVDPTTCQKARIMFWPSCPSDMPYEIVAAGTAIPLKADAILGEYLDWRNAAEWPGADEGVLRAQRRRHITGTLTDGRVKDPTTKDGWVGAFCKTYSIDDAITAFGLPYRQAGHDRWTYTGGSSYGGAVVYGDGRFLYSNHATDPVSGQLCNAFDLVRIHKFGDQDNLASPEAPANRLPSYSAMIDLCGDIDEVVVAHNQLILDAGAIPDTKPSNLPTKTQKRERAAKSGQSEPVSALADIDELLGSDDGAAPDKAWMAQLDASRKNLMPTPNNYDLIFNHDPFLKDTLRIDTFAQRKLVKRALPWDKEGEAYPREFTDTDIAELALYFSRKWKIHTGKEALASTIEVQMAKDMVHPVKEWLANLPEWDGVVRAETVLIRYLGADDTALTRAVTRKHLVAAVARVMNPGCKYDQVLVLCGPEGTGKSSIIEKLACGWYMDSNIPVGDKDAYQNLVGHWLVEMGELADYEAKSSAAYKNFISSQVDRYRPAYGREVVAVPRQCVFFGTTNETGFLKGRTGNRRFWLVQCPGSYDKMAGIFNGSLEGELPQIWAEVLHYYNQHESLTLNTSLTHAMRIVQEQHEDILCDDNREIIKEFILMAKPGDWEQMSIEARRNWYKGRLMAEDIWPTTLKGGSNLYLHEYISVKEIAMVVFDQRLGAKSRYEDNNLYYLCDHLACLEKASVARRFGKELGLQRCYKVVRNVMEDLPEGI